MSKYNPLKFKKYLQKKMTGTYVPVKRHEEPCPKCFRPIWVSVGQIIKQCAVCKNENKK